MVAASLAESAPPVNGIALFLKINGSTGELDDNADKLNVDVRRE